MRDYAKVYDAIGIFLVHFFLYFFLFGRHRLEGGPIMNSALCVGLSLFTY